ncbi:MAG: MBL fold metallo-hydrolase [Chitinophagaceae bacterium]|nr:MBL fold metallo-hydrolase [Chitinophagaceae bacterium]
MRSSILIQSERTVITIDATPDFRQQMLRLDNKKLDAILVTHGHKDHIGGMDDVRAYNYSQKKPIYVYANEPGSQAIVHELPYAFADFKYPGVPEINLVTIDETPFVIGDIPITPIRVWHHKLPVLGFRIGNFTYITDANKIENSQKEIMKGSSVLVVNALRREPHISHFTLNEAIELINEIQAPQAFLTHISHQMGLHDTVNKELPPHIQQAYDGLTFKITV